MQIRIYELDAWEGTGSHTLRGFHELFPSARLMSR